MEKPENDSSIRTPKSTLSDGRTAGVKIGLLLYGMGERERVLIPVQRRHEADAARLPAYIRPLVHGP